MKLPYYLECSVCGGIAFYLDKEMFAGDLLHAKDVVFPDGTRPEAHSEIICGMCKHNPRLLSRYLKENKEEL